MQINTEQLSDNHFLIFDEYINLEDVKLKKIKMLLLATGVELYEVFIFDWFENKSGTKVEVKDICNIYSILEQYKYRPIIVVTKKVLDKFETNGCGRFWQIDLFHLCIKNKFKIKNVFLPVYYLEIEQTYNNKDYIELDNKLNELCDGKYLFGLETKGQYRFVAKNISYPKVGIIIISSTQDLLNLCLQRLESTTYKYDKTYVAWYSDIMPEMILPSYQTLVELIKNDEPFNFGKINNYIFNKCCQDLDYIVLMNDDIFVLNPSWLGEMLYIAQAEEADIVGAALYIPGMWNFDRTKHGMKYQHAGVFKHKHTGAIGHINFKKKVNKNYLSSRQVDCVTFALVLIRAKVFGHLLFDERYPGDFSDVDFCLRAIKRGYKVWYCATSEAVHIGSATRARDAIMASDSGTKTFIAKHSQELNRLWTHR